MCSAFHIDITGTKAEVVFGSSKTIEFVVILVGAATLLLRFPSQNLKKTQQNKKTTQRNDPLRWTTHVAVTTTTITNPHRLTLQLRRRKGEGATVEVVSTITNPLRLTLQLRRRKGEGDTVEVVWLNAGRTQVDGVPHY